MRRRGVVMMMRTTRKRVDSTGICSPGAAFDFTQASLLFAAAIALCDCIALLKAWFVQQYRRTSRSGSSALGFGAAAKASAEPSRRCTARKATPHSDLQPFLCLQILFRPPFVFVHSDSSQARHPQPSWSPDPIAAIGKCIKRASGSCRSGRRRGRPASRGTIIMG